MRYDVLLTIDYNYASASDQVRNILRLMPQSGPGQRVERAQLSIDPPPDERRDGRDFFGNATTIIAWHEPVEKITFQLSARAERFAPPLADLSPPLGDLPALVRAADLGPASPQHFLAASPRIAPWPSLSMTVATKCSWSRKTWTTCTSARDRRPSYICTAP